MDTWYLHLGWLEGRNVGCGVREGRACKVLVFMGLWKLIVDSFWVHVEGLRR